MGKKEKFVFKRKTPPPDIVEVLDKQLLRDYVWQRPGSNRTIPVKVWRYIGLGIRNEGEIPKAYWYIVETQYDEPYSRTLKYGFIRRPQWDR